jgi:hypothetical protein
MADEFGTSIEARIIQIKMDDKITAYRSFIDWLTNTEGANNYSKVDLENYEQNSSRALEINNEKLAETYRELGFIFNSFTEKQKDALGNWCEYIYCQGITNCLEQIQYDDNIHLAYRKKNSEIELLGNIEYAKDFRNRHKVAGATEWE